jgi:hypothetical protein|tara:strand:+ start:16342 stop:17838 length:1497 start_codon:yes stop_codon:yes gene_type:complete
MMVQSDKEQLLTQGVNASTLGEQLKRFQCGFPFAKLIKPAKVSEGIIRLNARQRKELLFLYEQRGKAKKKVKFVPASGAATRMFKGLFEYLSAVNQYEGKENEMKPLTEEVAHFFNHLSQFPFYKSLKAALIEKGIFEEAPKGVIKELLHEKALNYGQLPKGLIKFHTYPEGIRTPVEEHLVEGCLYAADDRGRVHIHFTISAQHHDVFDRHLKEVCKLYEKVYGTTFEITLSEQKRATDTIAVDLKNEPIRGADGSLLFRPAGHGALIENLNKIDADLIFIKNIDNISIDRYPSETIEYKKILGGKLMEVQAKVFFLLKELETTCSEHRLIEMNQWVRNELGFDSSVDLNREALWDHLNRPIRVCGMVKNEGEPGGGPFWTATDQGRSLQIVEGAQVNFNVKEQKQIFEKASHFNPVDVVCGVKNHKNKKFNLLDFRDSSAGIITQKSQRDRDIKVQELPGLWNGAMAYWHTVFVEVPLSTFNPVKTINDLLKPAHH